MKILLAINSTRPKTLGNNTLRWAGQLGYDLAVFGPRNKRKKFLEALADVNYHWYLALEESCIVTKFNPNLYAIANGYDLIVYIPDDLLAWRKGSQFKPKEISQAFSVIGNARGEFSRNPRKRIKRFANGAVMERVL